jgi:hypothetical protein
MDNWRNEKYLTAVRYLPCGNCDAPPPSQASHSNQQVDGKGRSIRAHDFMTAALCDSCHREIDSGNVLEEDHRKELWNRAWRRTTMRLFLNGTLRVNATR